ncbi:hypothetical protein [Pseudoduganella aquatica]|uniref:Uncharacterized protein n=1 Tax=Pseudoduganella aquatica TaxID=2660641 RepID=A0A7X4KM51_9BURK|nr:hypothetical protein [Pseudoduganella aquatica]MYN07753.1 hypothetical protein [Pseudoduganella aquatica]
MSLFALIIDDEYSHSPTPRLIVTGPTAASVQGAGQQFDPYAPYTKIIKTDFAITQQQAVTLTSTVNNQPVPAHVCKLTAL